MRSMTPPKCCSGCKKTPPGGTFYAHLRRFTCIAHKESTPLPKCLCRKRESCSIGKLGLHKPIRCKSTWSGSGAAAMKIPSICSATWKTSTKPAVITSVDIGSKPSFPIRKVAAFTFIKAICPIQPV